MIRSWMANKSSGSAHAESYDAFDTSILVDDVETITLTASRTQFREDSGMFVSRVSVVRSNTDSDAEVVVLLNNPDAGEIAMPASVTIPAGTNSTEFYIDAVDDQLLIGKST